MHDLCYFQFVFLLLTVFHVCMSVFIRIFNVCLADLQLQDGYLFKNI